jgi:hypothetical protein
VTKPKEIKPIIESKHARICVYADPGVGKTRLVGTTPGRVLLIHPPTDHQDAMLAADRRRVERWKADDWDDMNNILEYGRHEMGDDFDWCWVDSASLLQDHLLDDVWDTAVREKPSRARYDVDQGEYGINMARLSRWMRHMVGPDTFNFGFTAHCSQLLPSQDPAEDKKLMPWIQGKNMSPKFCGYMNQVLFMEVTKIGGQEDRRVIRTHATERYYAKDQFDMDVKTHRVVDPTMPKIIELVEKSRGVPLGEPARARTNNRGGTTRARRSEARQAVRNISAKHAAGRVVKTKRS